MAVEIPLKAKYRIGGRAKKGAAAGAGDGTRKRIYHKATDAQKRVISASQQQYSKVVFGPTCNRSLFMPTKDVEAFFKENAKT